MDALYKIIAGLLDIKFDDLKRRDIQARNRRIAVFAGASFTGMLIMTTLLIFALVSRDTAIKAQRV